MKKGTKVIFLHEGSPFYKLKGKVLGQLYGFTEVKLSNKVIIFCSSVHLEVVK